MANEMRDRLVELLEQKMHPYLADDIADYLLENGVVVPPCKVGDVVYGFFYPRGDVAVVEEEVVTGFSVETDSDIYSENDFGRTVFLTKSEAEQKLKEMRGGE